MLYNIFFCLPSLAFFRKGPTFAVSEMERTRITINEKEDNCNENNETQIHETAGGGLDKSRGKRREGTGLASLTEERKQIFRITD